MTFYILSERFCGVLPEQHRQDSEDRLRAHSQGHIALPESDQRDHRVRNLHKQRSLPFRGRGRAKVAAAKVVSVLRVGHLDTVLGLLVGIRPGAAGRPENEQAGGVARHFRHDRQQPDICERVHNSVLEQARLAGEEGGQSGNGHPLVFSAVRRQLALDPRRRDFRAGHVHGREEGAEEGALPPLHHGRGHGEHQGRVQFGQRHDFKSKPGDSDVAVRERA